MSAKTTELIIYIADQLKDSPNYGAILLNKSLYYSDLMHYLKSGTTITDLVYVHQKNGPTPEPGRFMKLLQLLEESGDIEIKQVPFFNYKQKKVLSKRPPKITVFEKEEIVLINDVVKKIGDLSAKEVSDLTHELLSWKLSEEKETLPNFTFLLTQKEADFGDFEWAQQAWEKYNMNKPRS
jgi:hypothetical protein